MCSSDLTRLPDEGDRRRPCLDRALTMRALSAIRNLTGGRVPPLTRTALLCGLGLFLLAVLFVRPEAGGSAPAPALGNGVRLVPPGDARTESVVLLDSSAVFFPSRSAFSTDGRGEAGQPEDAPFPRTAPVLQFDPAKPQIGRAHV